VVVNGKKIPHGFKPANVACRQSCDRPVTAEQNTVETKTFQRVLEIKFQIGRLPGFPIGFGGKAGNFADDIRHCREELQIRRPRFRFLAAHIRLAEMVQNEHHFRHAAHEVGNGAQLLVADAEVEGETKFREQFYPGDKLRS